MSAPGEAAVPCRGPKGAWARESCETATWRFEWRGSHEEVEALRAGR
jgi:hypothetical protein